MSSSPNYLLIWTDQQRPDTLSCYGNTFAETPHLDRLASESFIFDRAYCAQPVCTPSRGTVMTGLWPHTHGCIRNNIPLVAEHRTIAEQVSDDYYCGYYGKWHLGDELVPHRGFEDWVSIEDGGYRRYYSTADQLKLRSNYHQFLIREGFPPDSEAEDGQGMVFSRAYVANMAEPYTKAGFLAREAARFIGEQKENRPFILSVNFLEPHPPFHGPLNGMYDPDEMPVGEAFLKPPGKEQSLKKQRKYADVRENGFKRHPMGTEWCWRRLMANYYGLVTLVDRAVGKILDALDASGLADNTIVVYTSDHGEMMGDHCLLGKGVMYEESVRIPWLMRVPWLSKEQNRIEGLVSHIDLVPTVLDLMGQPLGEHLQGVSRVAVLRGKETLAQNDIVIETNNQGGHQACGRTLVTHDGWKLSFYGEGPNELFDRNNDPYDFENLFYLPKHRERIRALKEDLSDWQQATRDSFPLPEV